MRAGSELGRSAARLSPNFDITVSAGPDGASVQLRGQTSGFNLDALRSVAGDEIAEAVSVGRKVSFRAPSDVFGLPKDLITELDGQWTVEGQRGRPVDTRLEALGPGGEILSDLRFVVAEPTIGHGGAELTCADRSGWFHMTVTLRPAPMASNLHVSVDAREPAWPEDIIALMDFLESLSNAQQMRLVVRLDGRDIDTCPGDVMEGLAEMYSPVFAQYASDIQRIQRLTGMAHTLKAIHQDDIGAIRDFVRQLDGEKLTTEDELTADMISIQDVLLAPGGGMRVAQSIDSVTVQDHEHQFQDLRQVVWCPRVKILNGSELRQAHANGRGCQVRFKPAEDEHWTMWIERGVEGQEGDSEDRTA